MDLAPTQFARIDGRQVSVAVTSAEEAKAAIKELRHKKRELQLWKRGLLWEKKRALQLQSRGRRSGYWQRMLHYKKGLFGRFMGIFRFFAARRAVRKVGQLTKELEHVDELLHKLDDCILQVEGRLLQGK